MLRKNPKVAVRAQRDIAAVRILGTGTADFGGRSGTFNETAYLVWRCLDYTTDLNIIAKTLAHNYGVPFETTYRDTRQMLENFTREGLLHATGTAEFPSPRPDAEPLDLPVSSLFPQYSGPILSKAGFVVTSKCNFDCTHCYVDKTRDDKMRFADWKRVLLQVKEMGCGEIMFIGGEPFMQPWLCDLMELAEAEGFVYYVDTNGFFLNDTVIQRLRALQHLMYIDVSVYGLRPETFRRVTRRDFEPEQILLTIRRLIDAGVTTYAKLVPMRSNMADLLLLPEINERYGLQIVNKYVPLHSSQDQIRGLDENIPLTELPGLLDRGLISVGTYTTACSHCGPTRCSINSDGAVSICENNILPRGNVLDESMEAIWQRVGREWQLPLTSELCGSCTFQRYCTRCDGISYLETGSVSAPVPYLCQFAQAMYTYYQEKGEAI